MRPVGCSCTWPRWARNRIEKRERARSTRPSVCCRRQPKSSRSSVCCRSYDRQNCVKIPILFSWFSEKNQNFRKSAGIPWNSGEIPWNFHRKITQFHQISAKFWENPERSLKICKIVQKSVNFELWVVQKRVHCADLEKCCKMSIYLQNSASIQLRTSLPKFAKKWPKVTSRIKVRKNIGTNAAPAVLRNSTGHHNTSWGLHDCVPADGKRSRMLSFRTEINSGEPSSSGRARRLAYYLANDPA